MLLSELHNIIQKKIFGISQLIPEQQNLLKELTFSTLMDVYYDICPFTSNYNLEVQVKVTDIDNFNATFEKQEDIYFLIINDNKNHIVSPQKVNKITYSKLNEDEKEDDTQQKLNFENIISIQYPGLAIKKEIMTNNSLLDDNFLISINITPQFCNLLPTSDVNFSQEFELATITKKPIIPTILSTEADLTEVPFPQDCLQLIIKKFEILTSEIFPTANINAKQLAEHAYEQALKRWQRSKVIDQNFSTNKKKYNRPF